MYEVTVTDNNYVIVTINGIEVDRPGPWEEREGAEQWAAAILADLQNGVDHYGIN